MKINVIGNTIKEGFKGIFRHPMITFASLTTVSLMLMVVGAFAAFTLNANSIVENIGSEPPVQIWLRRGADEAQVTAIKNELEHNPDVKAYTYQTPQDNYNHYRETLGEDASLLDSLDPEKLPHSFTVKLIGPESMNSFTRTLETYPGIDEIQYSKVVLDFLSNTSRTVNWAGLIVGVILLLISLLIISNMVRISILARAEEITIMKYIGATNSYIRVPYLLEGAFTGIIGALIAWALVLIAYDRVYAWAMKDTPPGSAWALLPPASLMWQILAAVLIIGTFVGAVGSAISVRKHVNV